MKSWKDLSSEFRKQIMEGTVALHRLGDCDDTVHFAAARAIDRKKRRVAKEKKS
jgi:hypothetical protein